MLSNSLYTSLHLHLTHIGVHVGDFLHQNYKEMEPKLEYDDNNNHNLNHGEKKFLKSRTYSMRTTPCNHTLFVMA